MIGEITADLVISWRPCWLDDTGGEARIRALLPTPQTPIQIIDRWLTDDLPDVSADDLHWLLLRPEVMGERDLRLWACDCAERTLPYWEREYPDDHHPREAIDMSRRYARGEATREDLESAARAARAAARRAEYAARAAAESAAWSAADSVARVAARFSSWFAAEVAAGSAGAAESRWQIERLRQYLVGEVQP